MVSLVALSRVCPFTFERMPFTLTRAPFRIVAPSCRPRSGERSTTLPFVKNKLRTCPSGPGLNARMRDRCVTTEAVPSMPGIGSPALPVADNGAAPSRGGGGVCAKADALSASPTMTVLNGKLEDMMLHLSMAIRQLAGHKRPTVFLGNDHEGFHSVLPSVRIAHTDMSANRTGAGRNGALHRFMGGTRSMNDGIQVAFFSIVVRTGSR